MGWNAGYTIFEATVVGAYDLGKLDAAMLSILMEPYRGSDIDSGGKCDLKSKDGLCVEEIVLRTFGKPIPVKPDLPGDYKAWTDAQDRANDKYWDDLDTAFGEIAEKFGWR